MKKILALVLALVMVLLCATAFAGTITVDNVKNGETYHAYKLLNYTHDGEAWSYYLTASEYSSFGSVLEGVGFEFTASSDGTIYTLNETNLTAAQITSALKNADLTNALQHVSKTASADGALTFDEDLEVGYWYVTSSVGALTSLQSYDAEALVVEKNSIPGENKTQSAASDGTYAKTTLDFNVGDTVYYNVDITDGQGTDQAITLTDTMTDGLTLNQDAITVTKDGTALTKDTDYTLTTNAHGFTLTLLATYVSTLNNADVVKVKYSAVINEAAVVDDADDNSNTATLSYSNQTETQTIYVETYDINLYKKDGEGANANALAGAKFNLYSTSTGGTALTFLSDSTGYYLSTASGASAEIDAGDGTGVNIRGLEPGTYYFEETVAPSGYNKLNERKSVVVNSGATGAAEITVVNNAGTQLPSTGGIGTTIFYIVGGLLVIGAAVILVARRKSHE